jgi:hypothetical protein
MQSVVHTLQIGFMIAQKVHTEEVYVIGVACIYVLSQMQSAKSVKYFVSAVRNLNIWLFIPLLDAYNINS